MTFDYTDASSGDIVYEEGVRPPVTIRYRGLEPLVNTGTAANIVFNMPNTDNHAILEDDGTTGNNISQLRSSNVTFETTTFTNPTSRLTINGSPSVEDIQVASAFDSGGGAGQFNADLFIDLAANSGQIFIVNPLNVSGALSFTTTHVTIQSAAVTSAGGQAYNASVATAVQINCILSSTGSGNISFGSGSINGLGSHSLTVNTAGATIFGGPIGGLSTLTSLTTDAAGSTQINGGSIRTTGAQTFNDAVTLGAGATLSTTSAGNITFAKTLNGAFPLAVNTAGTTTSPGPSGPPWP